MEHETLIKLYRNKKLKLKRAKRRLSKWQINSIFDSFEFPLVVIKLSTNYLFPKELPLRSNQNFQYLIYKILGLI